MDMLQFKFIFGFNALQLEHRKKLIISTLAIFTKKAHQNFQDLIPNFLNPTRKHMYMYLLWFNFTLGAI